MHGVTSPSKCDPVDSIREAAASAGSVQKLNAAYNIVIFSAKAMGLQKVCGAV